MLDPTEVLDLRHCFKTDPLWAKLKAGHCLADAAACDARAAELGLSNERTPDNNDWFLPRIKAFKDMAERYRARARILMGEVL